MSSALTVAKAKASSSSSSSVVSGMQQVPSCVSCVYRKFSKDIYTTDDNDNTGTTTTNSSNSSRVERLYCGEMTGACCDVCGSEIVTGCIFDWSSLHEQRSYAQEEEPNNEERRTRIIDDVERAMRNVLPSSVWDHRTTLQKLTIKYAPHEHLEPEIATLSQLKHLLFEECQYNHQLHHIGNLQKLERLDFVDCHTEHLPTEIYDLPRLEYLTLWRGEYQFVPSVREARKLRHRLHVLELWGTAIPTQIPTVYGDFTSLTRLTFVDGTFSEIPREIGRLQNLIILEFNRCENIVTLPEELFDLVRLRYIALSGRRMTSLSPSLGNLINLESLSIDCPDLRTFPTQVLRHGLPKLSKLNLDLDEFVLSGADAIFPPGLKCLKLRIGSEVTYQSLLWGVPSLRDVCPKLEYLDFMVCDWARDEDGRLCEPDCFFPLMGFQRLLECLPSTLKTYRTPLNIPIDFLVASDFPAGIRHLPCCDPCEVSEEEAEPVRALLEKYEQLSNVFPCDDYSMEFRLMEELPLPEYELFLMMFNKCGRVLLRDRRFPISMWPGMITKVNERVRGILLHKQHMEEKVEMFSASVIYKMLHCESLLHPRLEETTKVPPAAAAVAVAPSVEPRGPRRQGRRRKRRHHDISLSMASTFGMKKEVEDNAEK